MQQNLLEQFNALPTKKAAIRFAMKCTPEERLSLNAAAPSFLQGKYTGFTGETSLIVPLTEIPPDATYEDIMAAKATTQDAEAVYEKLFGHIAQELIEARKNGKPLSIHVGEAHPDRGNQMINLMVLDIARRLDINDIGFEATEEKEEVRTYDGRNVTCPAFNNWQDYHNKYAIDGIMPETDAHLRHINENRISFQPDRLLINKQELIPFAQNNGFHTFAIDTSHTDQETNDGMYWQREQHMLECVEAQVPHKDAVIFGGVAHLYGLDKLTKGVNTRAMCFINGEQNLFLVPPRPFHDDQTSARRTFPAFHPKLESGRVHSFRDAHELTQAASREKGNALEAEFKPQLEKASKSELTGMHLGGRTQEQLAQRRA